MTTKFPMSCAALSLLVLGGAAAPTNVQARGLSLGANAGRSAIPFASRNASSVESWNRPGVAGNFPGANTGRGAAAFARGPSTQHPQILRPDSLIKTSTAGGIALTEHGLSRFSVPQDDKGAPGTARVSGFASAKVGWDRNAGGAIKVGWDRNAGGILLTEQGLTRGRVFAGEKPGTAGLRALKLNRKFIKLD